MQGKRLKYPFLFSEQANDNFRESGRDLVETWTGSVRILDTFGGIKSQIF